MVNGRHKEIAARVKHMNGSTIKTAGHEVRNQKEIEWENIKLDDKGKGLGSTVPRETFKGGSNKKTEQLTLENSF